MVGGGYRVERNKGEKKWDNCNSTINKIYFKNQEENLTHDTTWMNFKDILLSKK